LLGRCLARPRTSLLEQTLRLALGHDTEQVGVEPGERTAIPRAGRGRGDAPAQQAAETTPERLEGRRRRGGGDPLEQLQGASQIFGRVGPLLQCPAIPVRLLHQPELEILAVGRRQAAQVLTRAPIAPTRAVTRAEQAVIAQRAMSRLDEFGLIGPEGPRLLRPLKPQRPGLGMIPMTGQPCDRHRVDGLAEVPMGTAQGQGRGHQADHQQG
jgi:hypothetical protein